MATAPSPSGPFIIAEKPVLTEYTAEDPFVWYQKDRFYAIVDDQYGDYLGFCGLALFESPDGFDWQVSKHNLVSKTEIEWENGTISQLQHLERPQLWFNDQGVPAMLFCAFKLKKSGTEDRDTDLTFNVHIPLKIN